MTARVAIAALLLAHALVHVAYLAPRPAATPGGPAWPFNLDHSWLLGQLGAGPELTRWLGIALIAATIAGFAVAAIAAVGIGPGGLWSAALTLGAIASAAVLLIFFHPWLVLGLVIDSLALWAALVGHWAPDGVIP
jgi:hypothetical protein